MCVFWRTNDRTKATMSFPSPRRKKTEINDFDALRGFAFRRRRHPLAWAIFSVFRAAHPLLGCGIVGFLLLPLRLPYPWEVVPILGIEPPAAFGPVFVGEAEEDEELMEVECVSKVEFGHD